MLTTRIQEIMFSLHICIRLNKTLLVHKHTKVVSHNIYFDSYFDFHCYCYLMRASYFFVWPAKNNLVQL